MLARTVHVRERCYTYLPNPTIFSWNRSTFSIRRLLKAFAARVHTLVEYQSQDLMKIKTQAAKLDRDLPEGKEDDYTPEQLGQLHEALNHSDAILKNDTLDVLAVHDVLRRHIQEVLKAINTPQDRATVVATTDYLKKSSTFEVDSAHQTNDIGHQIQHFKSSLQKFLSELSSSPSRQATRRTTAATTATTDSIIEGEISFDDLFAIPPEKQEDTLMEM